MNGLAVCAFPDVTGEITDELWSELHAHVLHLVVK